MRQVANRSVAKCHHQLNTAATLLSTPDPAAIGIAGHYERCVSWEGLGLNWAETGWSCGWGCFNSKPRAIISLCCTYRMLDLLLSIDMAHFSGARRGSAQGVQINVGVCERQILLTTCVRMNMYKCDCVCVCVCFLTCYTPCGRTEAVSALVFLGGR